MELDPDFGDADTQLARRSTWRAEVELRTGSSRWFVSGDHFCDCSEHVAGRCTITAARSSLWSSKLVGHCTGIGYYCSQQRPSQHYRCCLHYAVAQEQSSQKRQELQAEVCRLNGLANQKKRVLSSSGGRQSLQVVQSTGSKGQEVAFHLRRGV